MRALRSVARSRHPDRARAPRCTLPSPSSISVPGVTTADSPPSSVRGSAPGTRSDRAVRRAQVGHDDRRARRSLSSRCVDETSRCGESSVHEQRDARRDGCAARSACGPGTPAVEGHEGAVAEPEPERTRRLGQPAATRRCPRRRARGRRGAGAAPDAGGSTSGERRLGRSRRRPLHGDRSLDDRRRGADAAACARGGRATVSSRSRDVIPPLSSAAWIATPRTGRAALLRQPM